MCECVCQRERDRVHVCVFFQMRFQVRCQTFRFFFQVNILHKQSSHLPSAASSVFLFLHSYLTALSFLSLTLSSSASTILSPPQLSIYLSIFVNPTEGRPGRGRLHHHVRERESYRLL